MSKINRNIARYNKMSNPLLLTATRLDNLSNQVYNRLDTIANLTSGYCRLSSSQQFLTLKEVDDTRKFLHWLVEKLDKAIQAIDDKDCYWNDRYAIDASQIADKLVGTGVSYVTLGRSLHKFIISAMKSCGRY